MSDIWPGIFERTRSSYFMLMDLSAQIFEQACESHASSDMTEQLSETPLYKYAEGLAHRSTVLNTSIAFISDLYIHGMIDKSIVIQEHEKELSAEQRKPKLPESIALYIDPFDFKDVTKGIMMILPHTYNSIAYDDSNLAELRKDDFPYFNILSNLTSYAYDTYKDNLYINEHGALFSAAYEACQLSEEYPDNAYAKLVSESSLNILMLYFKDNDFSEVEPHLNILNDKTAGKVSQLAKSSYEPPESKYFAPIRGIGLN